MILSKKWSKHKVKSYIFCINLLLRGKLQKTRNQGCKQRKVSLFNFCNIFNLIFQNAENSKNPLFINLKLTYFPIMNNSGKFKEISSTSFYYIIPPNKTNSGLAKSLDYFRKNPNRGVEDMEFAGVLKKGQKIPGLK